MKDRCETVTLDALATRLDVKRSRLRPGQRLEEDWHLGSSELFLLALEVADALGRVMTFDGLASIRTVGDLVSLVRAAPTDDEAFEGKPVEPLWSMLETLPVG